MIFIGVDYSIRSPAFTTVREEQYASYYRSKTNWHIVANPAYKYDRTEDTLTNYLMIGSEDECFKDPKNYRPGFKRYSDLASWLLSRVSSISNEYPDEQILIGFEGASYGSPGRVVQLAENVGAAKAALITLPSVHIVEIAPQSLKKFATGNGRAEKTDMYNAFHVKTGISLTEYFTCGVEGNPLSDIVDSYWITQYLIHNKSALLQDPPSNGAKTSKKKKQKNRRKKAKFRYRNVRKSG